MTPADDEVKLRQLTVDELDLIEPLWNALREHHTLVFKEMGPPRTREDSWQRRRKQYKRWLSEPGAFLLAAETSKEVVGYAMVHLRAGSPTWPLSETAGELETLSILPDYRALGIGSRLLEAVRQRLKQVGVSELSLHVVPTSKDAIRFYERHGFGTFALWLTSKLEASGPEAD